MKVRCCFFPRETRLFEVIVGEIMDKHPYALRPRSPYRQSPSVHRKPDNSSMSRMMPAALVQKIQRLLPVKVIRPISAQRFWIFRWFDSSSILILRDGIPMSGGNRLISVEELHLGESKYGDWPYRHASKDRSDIWKSRPSPSEVTTGV